MNIPRSILAGAIMLGSIVQRSFSQDGRPLAIVVQGARERSGVKA